MATGRAARTGDSCRRGVGDRCRVGRVARGVGVFDIVLEAPKYVAGRVGRFEVGGFSGVNMRIKVFL